MDADAPAEVKDFLRHYHIRYSGPSGLTEQDLLRRVDGGWKIARRKVVLDQSVLLAKNLTFFF